MEYVAPNSLQETIKLLKKWKSRATLVAGGTNIVPDLRARAIQPGTLIDISRLKGLSYIREERKNIRVGGLTTISQLSSSGIVRKYAYVLFDACNQLGNPLVRNRATIGGNLADASPAADTAVPLLALEAIVVIQGSKSRQVPIDRFFVGPNRTVLKRDEMIKEIIIPKWNTNVRMAYYKLGLRNSMAISVVSIALLLEMDKRLCKKARIGLGAVAPKPVRVYQTEGKLMGQTITEDLIKVCCTEIEREISPISDIRASADYRRSMASILFRRCIEQILSEGKP